MALEYHKPASAGEAIGLMVMHKGRAQALAGGTDLLVRLRTGAASLEGLIDLSAIEELRGIAETPEAVEIGAMETHARIAADDAVRRHLPALACACLTVGGAQIQNRGTIGGNVMNASPAGDTLPVLLAHGAEFLVKNLEGERWVPAAKFFTGYRKTAAEAGELLARIRIPKADSKERSAFYKLGQRRAQAISKVSMCVRGRIRHGGIEWMKIALGSVAPVPVRAPGTEALLAGKVLSEGLIEAARDSLFDEISPIDDIRSTADYRRFAAAGLLARFLREALSRPGLFGGKGRRPA
ncbi:MAG: xanthine dehydrogenase family protein subunit M [Proteobacteria bacterium]|nr:xanthine dehydrogenase family protein subunit M [Pseudomonadota bacterium]